MLTYGDAAICNDAFTDKFPVVQVKSLRKRYLNTVIPPSMEDGYQIVPLWIRGPEALAQRILRSFLFQFKARELIALSFHT